MDSIVGRLAVGGTMAACMLAAVPSTMLFPPLPLTLLLTRRYRREEQIRRWHSMVQWARLCSRRILGMDVSRVGEENLPSPSRGHMFVSNHQSYADILVLLDTLEAAAFLSKGEILLLPVIGPGAYAAGSVFVWRRDKASRQRALDATIRMCRESTAVVVFPEGTRSPDGELQAKVHPRGLVAAREHGLRVVPVGLDGTWQVVPKGNDRINRGQRVAVTIGPALDPADYDSDEQWVDAIWSRVRALFEQSRARARG